MDEYNLSLKKKLLFFVSKHYEDLLNNIALNNQISNDKIIGNFQGYFLKDFIYFIFL